MRGSSSPRHLIMDAWTRGVALAWDAGKPRECCELSGVPQAQGLGCEGGYANG